MITIKDVTSILKMERIAAENIAKNSLIRSVSHELRTPVNGILLLVEGLMDDINDSCKERLNNIKTCAELLRYQISDILDYSELSSSTFKLNQSYCNLKACLEECASLVTFQLKFKGVELIKKIDPLIPNEFFTDSHRIQKVIVNLLTNAVKYTNKGYIELCAINIGNSIEISVKDTGIGIPKERLSQIFNMFSDKVCGMSGLGLHISNTILKCLGTHINVSSKQGKGSKFLFYLDLISNIPKFDYSNEIDVPSETDKRIEIPSFLLNIFDKQRPKILIADDNDFNRLLLGNLLEKHGVQFTEARNGKEAIKTIIK